MVGSVVVCIGVTPALQRTLKFEELVLGEVNRCSAEVVECASGKATNVARVINALSTESKGCRPVLVSFVGGDTGRRFVDLLDVDNRSVETVVSTRICQTLLVQNGSEATELVEEAKNPDEDEWAKLLDEIKRTFQDAALAVLTGSPPPASNPNIYCRILLAANEVRDDAYHPQFLKRLLMYNFRNLKRTILKLSCLSRVSVVFEFFWIVRNDHSLKLLQQNHGL